MNAKPERLIQCQFTLGELEFFNSVMVRDRILTQYVAKNLQGLEFIGVEVRQLEYSQPFITGKLLSYIKQARSL